MFQRLLRTNDMRAIALIRLLVGWVFLVEGILKFLLPDELGGGRFTTIGIPAPHVMGPFVGAVEIVCGTLVILGLFTRLAAIPLLIDISVQSSRPKSRFGWATDIGTSQFPS
jgi:putative oxidoreductase